MSIENINIEYIEEYYSQVRDILTRRDIEYLMYKGYDELLSNNIHYIFLSYLRYNTIIKILPSTSNIIYIREYDVNEIVKLLDGPLKYRNWYHIFDLYNIGFRDEVFLHYTGDIEPVIMGYQGENDVYEYIIRMHNVKYHDKYEHYYDIWYNIDPQLVDGVTITCNHKNIEMLLRLGLRDCDKYIKRPTIPASIFSIEWGTYYIAQYKLEDRCPYEQVTSLDSDVLVRYFRYFKKYGVKVDKRYDINVSTVTSEVLDIIDNISYTSIIHYYLDSGRLLQHIPEDICKDASMTVSHIPDMDEINRIINIGCITRIDVRFPDTSIQYLIDVALYLKNNNIKLCFENYDIITACVLLEYDIIDIEEIVELHIENSINLYKIIMYPISLIRISNRYPSIKLINTIIHYAPNIIDKIIIPEHMLNYIAIKYKNRTYAYIYSDINIITCSH